MTSSKVSTCSSSFQTVDTLVSPGYDSDWQCSIQPVNSWQDIVSLTHVVAQDHLGMARNTEDIQTGATLCLMLVPLSVLHQQLVQSLGLITAMWSACVSP